MGTYFLVHGSWYGAWCWAPLEKEMRALGHTCLSLDLPGHGSDLTPPQDITYQTYLDAISSKIEDAPGPVTLVGHSFGAMLAQSSAEVTTDKITELVFLAGNVAPSGCSLMDIVGRDPASLLGPNARIQDNIISTVKADASIPALFNRCSSETASWAALKLCPESIAPWNHKIYCQSSSYQKIPKYYIECTDDRAVTPFQQRRLRDSAPCDFITSIDADHSPFLSCPSELAFILHSISIGIPEGDSCWITRDEDRARRTK